MQFKAWLNLKFHYLLENDSIFCQFLQEHKNLGGDMGQIYHICMNIFWHNWMYSLHCYNSFILFMAEQRSGMVAPLFKILGNLHFWGM